MSKPNPPKPLRSLLTNIYFQVLIGVVLGIGVGLLWPDSGAKLKPLSDAFIKLVKMMVAPIIFFTVALGIAQAGNMRRVRTVGIKALIYFEVVSTLALVIGLVVINVWNPGTGMNIDPKTLDISSISNYTTAAKSLSVIDFLLNIIPATAMDAFAKGEILQVLLFSILFGWALGLQGEQGRSIYELFERLSTTLFKIIGLIMRLAPIGAFGAMAFTVGKFGSGTLINLVKLMGGVYLTCGVFIFAVLGSIARLSGFSLIRLLKHIKHELLLAISTSSGEVVLPLLVKKLESFGCGKSVVSLVIPTGYSFNMDGTSIYLTMAALFIGQATNVELDLGQQLTLLAILMLTSKGTAAVAGGGFITLAATLSSMDILPVAGLVLLLGVDRFMSEARVITNVIGNAVATVAIAKWEGDFEQTAVYDSLLEVEEAVN